MTDDEAALAALLVIGGLYAMSKEHTDIAWGDGWVWPVPDVRTVDGNLYAPVISDPFSSPRPDGRTHRGVDVMYARKSASDRPEYPKGTNGSKLFFAPPGTPILAAKAGRVWSAQWTPQGFTVVLDHGAPWATYYTHLDWLAMPLHASGKSTADGSVTTVTAGQPLGTMGQPPSKDSPRHLHFAPWYKGSGEKAAVDPSQVMRTWARVRRVVDNGKGVT